MLNALRYCLFALSIASSFHNTTASAAPASTSTLTHRGNLVSAAWLEINLTRPDLLLLDASPGQLHAAKHLPGAVNVDVFTFGGRSSSLAEMDARIQSWGVSRGKKIVIYDQGGTFLATSLFFDLYHHGFPVVDLFVLDGGLHKWQASGGAVTKELTPTPPKRNFRVGKLNEDIRARLAEFLVASGNPAGNALVEALEPDQHFGADKFFDRAGHIPTAIMAPSADFFNADKTFNSPAEIRRMLDYLGIKPAVLNSKKSPSIHRKAPATKVSSSRRRPGSSPSTN